MLSLQKRFLFIHVPKTGGNSIQDALRSYSEDTLVAIAEHQDGVERFEVRNANYRLTKHSTLSHYKSALERDVYNSLFRFATIRNPWDMMISHYFSPHRGVTRWDRKAFLKLLQRVPPLRHYIGAKPSWWRRGSKQLVSDVQYLIRFEQLEEDFQIVCQRLGLPPLTLPKRNQSNRSHYSQYYDEETKAAVGKAFAAEIALGGYNFEAEGSFGKQAA